MVTVISKQYEALTIHEKVNARANDRRSMPNRVSIDIRSNGGNKYYHYMYNTPFEQIFRGKGFTGKAMASI